jgi:hypothetical protein
MFTEGPEWERSLRPDQPARSTSEHSQHSSKEFIMGYGIGGILVLILVILAIIYFAKRV